MFNRLRRFIFDTSNLSQYIQILKESKDEKIIRLLRDPSNTYIQNKQFQLNGLLQQKGLLNKMLFGNLYVLNPINYYMLYWYVLVIFAILYNYLEFGIVLVYEGAWQGELTTATTLFFSCFTIFILFIDIIVQLNAGFLKRGMIILDRKKVVKNYLRGTFIIDITYVVLIVLCLATGLYNLNHSKYIWLFKLIRLSQIDDYILRRFSVKRIKKTIYTITKLVIIILILSHAIGVVFYIIDYYLYTNGIYGSAYCWISTSTAYSPIIGLPWVWQYYYSLYWGINTITTISYGDIPGANPTQLVYTTAMFCFGFMVYGYVVNQIIKVILWSKANIDKLRIEMLVMDIYMDNLKIPTNIKNQVRNHLIFLHKEQKNRNLLLQTQMRDKLPEDLRYQLVSNAYSNMNEQIINIFQSSTATKFLFNLVEKKYTFDEQVSNQGERALSLNYLHKGKMAFTVACGTKQQVIYESQAQNQFLGHYELFARKRWPFSIISKMGSTIYSIDRQKMFEQINSIQVLRQKFKQVEYEVIFKDNLKRIYHTCYFCQVSHDWTKCPSKFPIIKNFFHTQQRKRQDGIRIIRRKYHTLNDRKKLTVLNPIRNLSNKKLAGIIEKRISKIREKINQKNQTLQIDVAFDWKYYDINENLSKKKQYWNQIVSKRINIIKQVSQKSSLSLK